MLRYLKFWGLIAILITSVFGITAQNSRYAKQYIIDDYDYGIYLSNDNELFYNITPFDFSFYSLTDSKKLVGWEKFIKDEKAKPFEKLTQLIPTFLSSINSYDPNKTVKTEIGDFQIKTQTKDNKVTIETSIPLESVRIVKTITFNESDIVFDNDFEVYSNTSEELLGYFAEYSRYEFKDENENSQLNKNRIYVTNPYNPGVIEIKVPTSGGRVDKEYRVINLNTVDNEPIEITLHNKLEDIKL